jgi:release factor glutamine methyltransferase
VEIHKAELGELQALMKKELLRYYPSQELEAILRVLFSHITSLSPAQMVLEKNRKFTESEIHFLQRSLKRLKGHEPLQYITGVANFQGYEFKVDPSVLIPRPETEELVEWVSENMPHGENTRVLDIGTGSACIAISIKKKNPEAIVHAVDISDEALGIAKDNANKLDCDIAFDQIDILLEDSRSTLGIFDVIISNPPYVTPADREKMQKNVVDHEPGLALFVGEDDPLIFYREIIKFSKEHLSVGGKLYFECNEYNAGDVVKMLDQEEFSDIELRKDMQNKERMVMGIGC